jgi:hypothetical protein
MLGESTFTHAGETDGYNKHVSDVTHFFTETEIMHKLN